jgi:hypothetical protein
MVIYINLLGQQTHTESEEQYTYSPDLLDIFKDCISLDFIKNPVIIIAKPTTIHDQYNLIEWFSRSDTDPTTGVKINGEFKLKYVLNYIVAMTLLEYDQVHEKLIFHKPNIDLVNLIKLVEQIYKSNNNNTFTDDGLVHLDLDFYTKFSTCRGYTNNFTNYFKYKLEDILINDVYSGLPLVNPVIIKNLILNKETFIFESSGYVVGSLRGELLVNDSSAKNVVDVGIVVGKLREYFKKNEYVEKNLAEALDKMYCMYGFYSSENGCKRYFNTSMRTDIRNGDFYLYSTKTYEYIYNKYLQYKQILSKPEFVHKLKLINSCFSKKTSMLTNPLYGYTTEMLELRECLNFPILSNDGPYTDDFSFLDINDLILVPSGKNVDLKGREFVGTNFFGTEFHNMTFSVCTFVASNLTNAIFSNCEFRECVFYKCDMANCKFLKCNIDTKTSDMLRTTSNNFNAYYS